MIFKSVQVDGFVKKPDEKIRAVLVYGSNDGLRRDTVKRLAAAVCPDLNDPFRAAELAGRRSGRPTSVCFTANLTVSR